MLLNVDIGCRVWKKTAILVYNPYPAGSFCEKESAILSDINRPRHVKILGKHLNPRMSIAAVALSRLWYWKGSLRRREKDDRDRSHHYSSYCHDCQPPLFIHCHS